MDLTESIESLKYQFLNLEIDTLNISAYNKRYLKHYQLNIDYYLDSYSQLLSQAISKLVIPINEAVFLDYGGGSGLLSYFAVVVGFKKVIYNDLYEISVNDVKIMAKKLELGIDEFIVGDIKQVTTFLNQTKIYPNLICSFDVLEHIYDINEWIIQLKDFRHPFKLLFKTSANGSNPVLNKRLRKIHRDAELNDRKKEEGWKEIDLHTSFLKERQNIIRQHFSQLSKEQVNKLATLTRGLAENDIKKEVSYFLQHGKMKYRITDPTNTCDPYTGNWTEKIIDTKTLYKFIKSQGFACSITNSYFSYSDRKIVNLLKYILNQIIRLTGKRNLLFSPSYTVEIEHKGGFPEES